MLSSFDSIALSVIQTYICCIQFSTFLSNFFVLVGSSVFDDAMVDDQIISSRSVLLGIGWLRTICTLVWFYGTSDSLSGSIPSVSVALENYRFALEDGLVDPPASRFADEHISYQGSTDGLYR